MMNEYKKELGEVQMSDERKAELEELLAAELEGAGGNAATGKVVPIARGRRGKRSVKVAVALVACLALGGGAAYGAASYAGFFDGAFGTGWRSSTQAEVVSTGRGEIVHYPASDVAPVDQDEAERLLGGAVSDDSATIEWPDGHVLTVDSVVRSEDVAVYHFTLHRDGGVTALDWDEGTNRSKGAAPADDCDYTWQVGDDDFIYVDPDASTDDTLVGYGYTVFEEPLAVSEPVKLSVEPRESGANGWQGETATIACAKTLDGRTLTGDFGTATVTPIGLTFNGGIQDPGSIKSIVINFNDGTSYTVEDEAVDLDNELAACGFDDGLSMAFNRLVDPDKAANVTLEVEDPGSGEVQTVTLK